MTDDRKTVVTHNTSRRSTSTYHGEPGSVQTVRSLMNILLMVLLSLVTMAFIYLYAKKPVAVVVAACGFIALYATLILYVVNAASDEDPYEDPALTVILRWSTMVVLLLSILVAIASLVGTHVSTAMKAVDKQQQQQQGSKDGLEKLLKDLKEKDGSRSMEDRVKQLLRDGDRGGRNSRRNGRSSRRGNNNNNNNDRR